MKNLTRFTVRLPTASSRSGFGLAANRRRLFANITAHIDKQVGVKSMDMGHRQPDFNRDWEQSKGYSRVEVYVWTAEHGKALNWQGVTARDYDAWVFGSRKRYWSFATNNS